MSGPTGVTGMTGLQGPRGVTGPARYAYQGPPFGYETARLTSSTPSDASSKIYLTPQNFGTWYNITSNLVSTNNPTLTIYFPFYNPTYSTAPPLTITGAAFGTYLTITTSTAHNLRVQSLVTLAGLSDFASSQNGTFRVFDIISATVFRVTPTYSGPGSQGNETGTVTESTAVETTNEAYPIDEQAGSFWVFKNNYSSVSVSIIFSNAAPIYQGAAISSMTLTKGYKITVLYTGTNFIVL